MIGVHPWLRELGGAANECPIEPGFFVDASELLYVSARGLVYLVRDTMGTYCLIPRPAVPVAAVRDEEAEDDRLACLVAEAADGIDRESLAIGWYQYRGYFFHHGPDETTIAFKSESGLRRETVAEIPAGAVLLDVVPGELQALLDAVARPVGGERG